MSHNRVVVGKNVVIRMYDFTKGQFSQIRGRWEKQAMGYFKTLMELFRLRRDNKRLKQKVREEYGEEELKTIASEAEREMERKSSGKK